PDGTGAAPMTGAPAAHCLIAFTATRASRTVRLSEQIHHGYDLLLDWKLTRACAEGVRGEP
ncbi:MAG TPA: hypothetical protein VK789_01615, partial [Bryobacteraceae bacterium]|nr:hypothetical protein [Bryobacteraceae bacterium]